MSGTSELPVAPSTSGLRDVAAARALLARSPVFGPCRADDLDALATCGRHVDFADGTDIVREGDAATELMVIEAGEVAVLKRGTGDSLHELNRLHAGDSLGEMALFGGGRRSATVRAVGPVRLLALPIDELHALARARPSFVTGLMGIAGLVAERLRTSSGHAVAALERALEQERTRVQMGKFTFSLIVAYSLYTWVLGTATQIKEALGRSELVTVPVILVTAGILVHFMRSSGYPARFFGLTGRHAGRHVREALLLTLPWMAIAVLLKMWLVRHVPAMAGAPVFQMFAPVLPGGAAHGFNPWLTLAYVVFVPFQELIYRGGLQGALSHFLTGRWHNALAIIGSNVIFSAAHLYISTGLAATAFVAGLFWGWLYSRQQGLAGVSVSHVVLGFWAFEIVGLGVLE